jgi:MFS-type transporter involved in bile tolerance (Atg22 family)
MADVTTPPAEGSALPTALPRAVLVLSAVSLFTDIGSEMMLSNMPAFLALLPGGGTLALGILEATSESTSSLLKYAVGVHADKVKTPKPWVVAGYMLSALTRPFLFGVSRIGEVIVLRVIDRFGKGIRSAPRDAILSASLTDANAGRGFGFHRSMDHLGAALGPLLGFILLSLGASLRTVMLVAAAPSLLALVPFLWLRSDSTSPKSAQQESKGPLPRTLYPPLVAMGVFAIANCSDLLLLVRARELGTPARLLPLLWCGLNVSKALLTARLGGLSDRFPKAKILAAAYGLYVLFYAAFALPLSPTTFALAIVLYGVVHALQEPAEKAWLKQLAPEAQKARTFGTYYLVTGFAALPATLGASLIWEHYGSPYALGLSAAIAIVASALALLARS